MNRKLFAGCAAAAVLACAGTPADAAPLVVDTDFGQTYLAAGATLNLSMDINAAAGGGGLGFGTPYAITGGSVTFNFADDFEDGTRTSRVTTSEGTVYLPNGCYGCLPTATSVLVDHIETWVTNPAEGASATVGGTSAMAGNDATADYDSWSTSLQPTMRVTEWGFQQQVTRWHCKTLWGGTQLCDSWLVYNRSTTYYYYATDPFSITLALDSVAIGDLAADGVLGFSLFGRYGDVFLTSARLNLDIEPSTTQPPVVTAVPEPATASLLALCLAALGARPDRRRKRA